MRKLVEHQVNPANDDLMITVIDEPGAGGANHIYHIEDLTGDVAVNINFQNGPIAEVGVNGVTHEALLAIVADRLRSFQAGPYACQENATALDAVNAAQRVLQSRTLARMARGVEGTNRI